MLKDEVVEAVKNGKFHIYAAKTIDEGIEILTGVPAGKKRKSGTYPKDTINYLVDQKLKNIAEKSKGFFAEDKKDKNNRGKH
jgi:predicted ATP-dependent protease